MSKESAMAMLTGNPMPQAAPEAVTEQTSQPVAQPAQADGLKSDPFKHLAKKEESLLKDRQALKAEREALEKDRKVVLEAKKQYDEYMAKKSTDPIAAMKMLGFSETDIMNYLANQAPPELTPEEKAAQAAEKAAEAKIKEFQDTQAKKEQEAAQKRDEALISDFRNEIASVATANKDDFEYCNYYGKEAYDLAFEISKSVVRESNGEDFVDAKEALQMAEEYFEERDKSMANLKKRQKWITPSPSETKQAEPTRTRTVTPPQGAEPPKPAVTRTRTLHNGATSTVASTRIARSETREEKRERLMTALREGIIP